MEPEETHNCQSTPEGGKKSKHNASGFYTIL